MLDETKEAGIVGLMRILRVAAIGLQVFPMSQRPFGPTVAFLCFSLPICCIPKSLGNPIFPRFCDPKLSGLRIYVSAVYRA